MRLAAGLDLELFWSELDKRMAKRDEALKEWFNLPHANPRTLSAAAEGGTAPILLDLGAPSGGLAWAVQQVVGAATGALTTVAAANVTAGVFKGGFPSNLAQGIDFAALVSPPLTVPFFYQAGGKSVIARQSQHLYVVLQGAGTNANGWFATATVVEVPDTIEAVPWL